nr:MAG TPA: ASCH domain protein [Caudoviricetes sp.]
MAIKPILFNTEMVRAILDGRKSCTRRLVKPEPQGYFEVSEEPLYIYDTDGNQGKITPPYQPSDILYVRESYSELTFGYVYKADGENIDHLGNVIKWHPSIHMPKEAARIWLKVTDVRVERLQEITEEQACMEGTDPWDEACYENNGWHPTFSDPDSGGDPNMIDGFHKLWNSTIKKSDLDRYGWDANPWVWAIEYERCEKPKGV